MKRDEGDELPGGVDVALDYVAAERRAGGGGELEVDGGTGGERAEGGAREGFGGEIGGELGGFIDGNRSEADAVDGDAVAGVPAAGEGGCVEKDARGAVGRYAGDEGAGGFDESSEHRYRVPRSGVGYVGPGVGEVAGGADVL